MSMSMKRMGVFLIVSLALLPSARQAGAEEPAAQAERELRNEITMKLADAIVDTVGLATFKAYRDGCDIDSYGPQGPTVTVQSSGLHCRYDRDRALPAWNTFTRAFFSGPLASRKALAAQGFRVADHKLFLRDSEVTKGAISQAMREVDSRVAAKDRSDRLAKFQDSVGRGTAHFGGSDRF